MSLVGFVLFLCACLVPSAADARDDRELERENLDAMEDYLKGDVRGARARLRAALRQAKRSGARGVALARVYANLGVVLARRSHDLRRAVRSFRRALAEDPTLRLDPQLATEPVRRALFEARRRASGPLAPEVQERVEHGSKVGLAENSAGRELLPSVTLEAPALPSVLAPEPQPLDVHTSCERDAQCGAGLECREQRCRALDGVRQLVQTKKSHEEHAAFFFELGAGIGVTSLTRSSRPSRLPEGQAVDRAVASSIDKVGRFDSAEVDRALQEEGWNCDERAIENRSLTQRDCSVAVTPGLTSEPIFDLAIGYHLMSRVAVALTAMLQVHHGKGPMAGKLLGARVEYMLSAPVAPGPQLAVLAGAGVGALHAQARGANHERPHATNASPGKVGASLSLGVRAAYRWTRNLAVNVTPLFNVGVPNLLLDMGLTGGVEVAY